MSDVEDAGKAISRQEIKDNMGRGSIRSTQHQGDNYSRYTEHEASRNLERGVPRSEPTKMEIDMVFKESPSDVKIYRTSGMSDTEIYQILKNR